MILSLRVLYPNLTPAVKTVGSDNCQRGSDACHDVLHAGDGDAVAQRLIPRRVGRVGNVRPAVREALEPLAFQRRKAADEVRSFYDAFVLRNILAVGTFAVAAGERTHGLLEYEVGCVPALAGAFECDSKRPLRR